MLARHIHTRCIYFIYVMSCMDHMHCTRIIYIIIYVNCYSINVGCKNRSSHCRESSCTLAARSWLATHVSKLRLKKMQSFGQWGGVAFGLVMSPAELRSCKVETLQSWMNILPQYSFSIFKPAFSMCKRGCECAIGKSS
jgi:hypothetical protein